MICIEANGKQLNFHHSFTFQNFIKFMHLHMYGWCWEESMFFLFPFFIIFFSHSKSIFSFNYYAKWKKLSIFIIDSPPHFTQTHWIYWLQFHACLLFNSKSFIYFLTILSMKSNENCVFHLDRPNHVDFKRKIETVRFA